MNLSTPGRAIRINRFLPYWAVLQSDIAQTARGWVYRVWVLLSLLASVGCLLYRFGAYRVAGMVQPATDLMSNLLEWTVLGSITLIIILTAGSISSERGTMADSVLSRGISRYQYFLGKWHARLLLVVGTFFVLGLLLVGSSALLLRDEQLSLTGSLVALVTVAALLMTVISCGVSISAMCNSTILGISFLWLLLYGAGFMLSLLPIDYPSPDRVLKHLPNILRGYYDLATLGRLVLWSTATSVVVALFGMLHFARRDV
jgi:ABC-2 type transport system permease protein